MNQLILVLDFGGLHKELITRCVRDLSVYAEIKPGHISLEDIKKMAPIGIILTGGSYSSHIPGDPTCDPKLSNLGIPILEEASLHFLDSVYMEEGREVLKKFLFDTCGAVGDYKLDDYIERQMDEIRQRVKDEQVLLALSGGVDSAVCAALLSKAIPGQLNCIFVDHGLMRLGEGDEIEGLFKDKLKFIRVNAKDRFLSHLAGVVEPEEKRKIIGREFLRVFEDEAVKFGHIKYFAQGTIYPDIVESGGEAGTTIKSHHNVGGLPDILAFDGIIEPLAGLFKNEVRIIGRKLKLPAWLVNRQPFPGPGLAIRIMGEVTEGKLEVLSKADAILREEIKKVKNKPDQYFAVLTDTRSVGVKGDDRTYDPVVALRAVTTIDFMTCEYTPLSHKVLGRISQRITDEIPCVSRVVYDITSKPPGTIEWE